MRIYIGSDRRTLAAYAVAEKTAKRYGCEVTPVDEFSLRYSGMLTRPTDRRSGMYDLNSDAPQSTEFAISRFFVPLMAQSGWCLFVDSDVVFMEDPHELLMVADPDKAVFVVQHRPFVLADTKMDNQVQTNYSRKLWSSVVLWNLNHEANKRLNLMMLNQWPGRDLHAFKWLADSEIGELPSEANWLVGLQPKPRRPIIAHFTLGTPDMPGYEHCEHADIWLDETVDLSGVAR